MKKGIKKLLGKDGDPSSPQRVPTNASISSLAGSGLQLETTKTRIVIMKTPDARHMPFSVLTTLMNNFVRQIDSESKVYSTEYPVYRDPSFTHDVLCLHMERCKEHPQQSEQLLYSDLLLLGSTIKEHLGRIDDETCDLEVWKRGKREDCLVGKGSLGFTKAAMLVDGPASNTTDVRW